MRRGRDLRDLSVLCIYRGKAISGHNEKVVIYMPRSEASPEPKPGRTLILDFSFQNREKINFCCLSRSACSLLYGSLNRLIKVAFPSWVYKKINDNAFMEDIIFLIVSKNQLSTHKFGMQNNKL